MLNCTIVLLIICLFSTVELVASYFVHGYDSCELYRENLAFIEISGMVGFFSTLTYFALKELQKNHSSIYLILSNIYFVSMICLSLYWLIELSIESRRFFDRVSDESCRSIEYYFVFACLVGNYLLLVLIVVYIVWFCCADTGDELQAYAHATLIHA